MALALPACGDDGGQTDEAGSSDDGTSSDDGNDPTGNDDNDDTTGADDTTTSADDTTTSADDTTDDGSGTDTTGGPAQAQVRVIHGSPDAPAVDVYVNGEEALAGVTYAQISDYLALDAGEYDIAVYVSPADTSGDPVVAVEDFAVGEGEIWTVMALGSAAEGAPAEAALRLAPFQEEFDAPGGDEVQVRVVHGVSDLPVIVDIDVFDLFGAGELPCEASDITDFEFGDDSGAAGIALPAEAVNIAICFDANDDGVRDAVFDFYTADLSGLGGSEAFLIADGLLAASDFARDPASIKLLAATGETTGDMLQILRDPVVYFLHGVPDVGPVDICSPGQNGLVQRRNAIPFAGNAAPANAGLSPLGTFLMNQPVANFTLHPDAAGNQTCPGEGVPFPIDAADLEPGGTYIVAATGLASGSEGTALQQRIYADLLSLDPAEGSGVLRAIHMSPDTPEVDVGAEGVGFGLFPDLDFLIPPTNDYASDASAPEGLEVAAGTYNIQAGASSEAGADAEAAAATFTGVTVADGTRAHAIVVGSFGNEEFDPLSLVVIDMSEGDGSWAKAAVPVDAPN